MGRQLTDSVGCVIQTIALCAKTTLLVIFCVCAHTFKGMDSLELVGTVFLGEDFGQIRRIG